MRLLCLMALPENAVDIIQIIAQSLPKSYAHNKTQILAKKWTLSPLEQATKPAVEQMAQKATQQRGLRREPTLPFWFNKAGSERSHGQMIEVRLIVVLSVQSIQSVQSTMVFYIIGLGLGDPEDISVKALKAIRSCKEVYLQYYTSIMSTSNKELQSFLGVKLIEADRDFCEIEIDHLLDRIAQDKQADYAFLVVGDAFCATTHSDLFLRAAKLSIEVKVIHNASIISAVGCCGLQVYRFGEVVSVPLWTEKWRPDSWYQKILQNRRAGLHTLVLVDIKVKERTEENILKDRKIYEPPRFMTIKECVEQLLEAEAVRGEEAYAPHTRCFGLARVGAADQLIRAGTLGSFIETDMGPPLHSFVLCAEKLHHMEEEMYQFFMKK